MKKLPIFIALDVDQEKKALDFAEKLSPYVLGFKVGPRLYFCSSPQLIPQLSRLGKVFLDFKFYDIPSTMEASVKACFEMNVDYLTVHAAAGKEALSRAARIEKNYKGQVLAVTVLSSQKQEAPSFNKERKEEVLKTASMDLKPKQPSILNKVLDLAQTAFESGLKGLVASPYEVQALKQKYFDFFIAVPGIRMSAESRSASAKFSQKLESPSKEEKLNFVENEDQSRTASPSYALEQGASALVIGRPVLQAEDPIQVLQDLSLTLS